jgi:valyl-tRNA synthetase
MEFFATESKQLLLDWFGSISIDWPVSRTRYYATEIPIWTCKCGYKYVNDTGKYLRPWIDPCPLKKCPKCSGNEWVGEQRIFDTWFDSSISNMFILGYGYDDEFFKKNYPCSFRPQGKEIVRTWLYYSLLKGYLINKLPMFENVYVHQHILDNKGYKMSKSKGNVINPQDATQQYGAESFRLWAVSEGNLDQKDFNCSLEKISSEQKTLNKIWNIAKFISLFKKNENVPTKYNETDLWILSEINKIVEETKNGFEAYDFHRPITKLKYFIWDTFSSHYLELVKRRCYNQENEFSKEEQNGAIDALNYVFKRTLYLLYPITPFITKRILQDNYNENIYNISFPNIDVFESKMITEDIEKVNNSIWKAKKDANKSLKENVSSVVLPNKYKNIEIDLLKAHSILNAEYKDISEIEIKM